jgi:hypothetical protein
MSMHSAPLLPRLLSESFSAEDAKVCAEGAVVIYAREARKFFNCVLYETTASSALEDPDLAAPMRRS